MTLYPVPYTDLPRVDPEYMVCVMSFICRMVRTQSWARNSSLCVGTSGFLLAMSATRLLCGSGAGSSSQVSRL